MFSEEADVQYFKGYAAKPIAINNNNTDSVVEILILGCTENNLQIHIRSTLMQSPENFLSSLMFMMLKKKHFATPSPLGSKQIAVLKQVQNKSVVNTNKAKSNDFRGRPSLLAKKKNQPRSH